MVSKRNCFRVGTRLRKIFEFLGIPMHWTTMLGTQFEYRRWA